MRESERYLRAFVISIAGFLANLAAVAIWVHVEFFPGVAINGASGAVCYALAMVGLSRHLDAKFKEDMEDIRRRIYGK
jgi:hypothetical protein